MSTFLKVSACITQIIPLPLNFYPTICKLLVPLVSYKKVRACNHHQNKMSTPYSTRASHSLKGIGGRPKLNLKQQLNLIGRPHLTI